MVAEDGAEGLFDPLALPRRVDLLDIVPERAQQLGGVAHRPRAHRIHLCLGNRGHRRGGDPQPGGALFGGLRERPRWRRRPGGVSGLIAREHIEDGRSVGEGAREHPVDSKRGVAQLGGGRDAPARRLEADQAAAGGGDPDRATAVVAVRHREHPGRHRRGGPARGAAGRALQVPGVVRRAEEACLAGGQDAVLGQRRRADDHEAGIAQAPCDVVVIVGHVVGHQPAAVGEAQALDGPVVLDGRGDAREGTRVAGRDRVGGGQRTLGVDLHEGVELGVELLDAIERALHELARGDLAGAHHAGELAGRTEHQIAVGHDSSWDVVGGRCLAAGPKPARQAYLAGRSCDDMSLSKRQHPPSSSEPRKRVP